MSSHVFTSPLPDVEIPNVALTEYVFGPADAWPDRVAMIDGASGREFTFAEMRDQIARLAGGLAARGFGPGSTLALMAPNMPEYALVFHAAGVAGGTVTTINPVYGADEVRFQLNDAGAEFVITVPDFVETATAALVDSPADEVIAIGTEAFDALFGDPIEQVPVDPAEQVIVLPYSSGTTGLPKGVMLTHRNLVANLAQAKPMLDYGDDEVALAFLPFFHIYGMQVLMNGLLAEGVKVITLPRFDMEQVLSLVQDESVTQFFAVPPIVLGLAKHPSVESYDMSSLRKIFSGAAPLGGELAQEAEDRLGAKVVQGYGMTELSPISHSTVGLQSKPGSNGFAAPNTSCRIVDPEGNDLGPGEEGELWIKGPQVMKGYLNNPEATAATIDADGWLHTGDVARIDPDDHMYIVDRVKELIKFKGFQVPPAELEALIITHPSVADVAVIGVPEIEAGELPKAFVVVKPGEEVTEDEIKAFVKAEVASYKQIRLVEFVDSIPKSASGKILRRMLRNA